MSNNFLELSLWDLAYNLDPTDAGLCSDIDKHLADKINSTGELNEIYYYLCYGDMFTFLPNTKAKINKLFKEDLKLNTNAQWHQFKNFMDWLEDDLKADLANKWLNNDDINLNETWMASLVSKDTETSLKVLSKLVRLYKKKKSSQSIAIIEKIFLGLDSTRISEACEILSKSTPAVISTMLKRSDVPEKYTIKSLRALSKLSKQRDMDIQIDFNTLGHLGPKSRLDAMKQLMGMFDKYYQFKRENSSNGKTNYYNSWKEQRLKRNAKEYNLPFKEVPKRSDIERFLFPCAIKYNDEVVSMMERFDELINKKEKE